MRALVLLMVLMLVPAAALAQQAPQISSKVIDPQPVEPGGDLTLTLSFYNPTASPISDFRTELVLPEAFALKSQTSGLVPGSALCGYCTSDNTYFLHVSPAASTGTYRVQARASSGNFASVKDIDVEVRGKPNLVLGTPTAGLDALVPDQRFELELELTVRNVGTGPAFEVTVTPASAAVIAIGSGTRSIAEIGRGSAESVTVPMLVSATTKPGAYLLPFNITSKDAAGAVNATAQSLGVRVVEAGKLAVQNVKVTDPKGQPLRAGPATVIVRVENTGHGDAEAIEAALACPFDAEKKAFLGRLKPDEDAPAVFDFASVPAGEHRCALTLTSRDDLGEHTQRLELAVAAGFPDVSGVGAVVVVIAVAALVFRRRIAALVQRERHRARMRPGAGA